MTVELGKGTFSLEYRVEEDHKLHSLDWGRIKDENGQRIWSYSRREGAGWPTKGQIGDQEKRILPKRFYLELLESELSLEEIRLLGPKALIQKRRWLEQLPGYERHEVKSETLDYKVSADDHTD